MHQLQVFSAFHPGSSGWEPDLATRSPHHSHQAAFHPGLPRWKRIWLPGTLLTQTKLPPRQDGRQSEAAVGRELRRFP